MESIKNNAAILVPTKNRAGHVIHQLQYYMRLNNFFYG